MIFFFLKNLVQAKLLPEVYTELRSVYSKLLHSIFANKAFHFASDAFSTKPNLCDTKCMSCFGGDHVALILHSAFKTGTLLVAATDQWAAV